MVKAIWICQCVGGVEFNYGMVGNVGQWYAIAQIEHQIHFHQLPLCLRNHINVKIPMNKQFWVAPQRSVNEIHIVKAKQRGISYIHSKLSNNEHTRYPHTSTPLHFSAITTPDFYLHRFTLIVQKNKLLYYIYLIALYR